MQATSVFPASCLALACAVGRAQEQVTWISVDQRYRHAMATDQAARTTVLFGGLDLQGNFLGDTWEHSPTGWVQRLTGGGPNEPSPRADHAMAFATLGGNQGTILFGGTERRQGQPPRLVNDTWRWDSNQWSLQVPAVSPPPRTRHAMAFDLARQRLVLFGGFAAGSLNDTWEWDGTNWLQMSPMNRPSARFGHAMAYDQIGARVLLFGGSGYTTETWAWDGTNWTSLSTANAPTGRLDHAMAYDFNRNEIVLFGGKDAGNQVLSDTWLWNRTAGDWMFVNPPTRPAARCGHAMSFDTTRPQQSQYYVLMVGGLDGNGVVLRDSWKWDGVDWSIPEPLPAARDGHGLAYDGARRNFVMFGGMPTNRRGLGDTWLWSGQWTQTSPASSPPGRSAVLAYQERSARTLLFGGQDSESANIVWFADTWEWDGVTWNQIGTTSQPSPRSCHGMVYDFHRDVVVLVGGYASTNTYVNDAWEWTGSRWNVLAPLPGLPRCNVGIAYDRVRRRVVVFGGESTAGFLAETWEYDGLSGTWSLITPATSPSPRRGCGMTFDVVRERTVLFGGQDQDGLGPSLADTWEWDGTMWERRVPTQSAPDRFNGAMAYDYRRGRSLLFGGDKLIRGGPFTQRQDTWEYYTEARTERFGRGCAGSAGVPSIASDGGRLPWVGEPFTLRLANVPTTNPGVSIVLLGFSEQSWLGLPLPFPLAVLGLPGCELFVSDDASFPVVNTNPTVSIPIPNNASLVGMFFYNQALVLDTGINAFGATTTNAVRSSVALH